MTKSFCDQLTARISDGRFRMSEVDPDSSPGLKHKRKAVRMLNKQHEELYNLQERLYAEHKRSVLVVLQAMDTGGKDGTITHVIGGLNPQAVQITPFKAPTPEEKRHGFLWRIRRRVPTPGLIGIFNRSHYEDVLVARVKNLAEPEVIERRYAQINKFEEDLVKAGTTVIKICLHISYAEQRARLLDRLNDPDKHWKFSENDINERAFWDDYQSAYSIAISKCSTKWAPWYVIPANDKDYRNWAVTEILIEHLKDMSPEYPRPKLPIHRLKKRLLA
jgi:PPK2 family polyphosphate:nucleotide phosphotransferase